MNKNPTFGGKLLVLIEMGKDGKYDTYEKYTDLNEKTIMALGYLPARGYKEEFRYANTKVYVKLVGFKVYDIRNCDAPNLETSSTLNDYFMSDAQQNFLKGMTRITFAPLDLKKLGGVALIGVGILFGLILLGGVI